MVVSRWRTGDRVTLRYAPGHWRITRIERPTVWLEGTDSFAQMLASLSPCGTVGINVREIILDITAQGELL